MRLKKNIPTIKKDNEILLLTSNKELPPVNQKF